ncbi:beta-1,3-galactosyltransferase 5-like [Maniola hyperantus]|uniref:beta-1,3-galactosyltransferase 5-like n=1 Tax=Aphantopus hyperantus TaxID=2795564 RepID=UPI001568D490|nr:beta-1,3-galactosyltransferase 5-like [Maniola hyperantus]
MTRKVVYLIVIALLSVLIWIYRSSNLEFSNTVLVLTQNNVIKNTLIQPHNSTCNESPFIVIIVTSYVGHVELRSAHRRAMPSAYLSSLNITRVFLLARIPKNERYITQDAINNESIIFGDILQGSFYENYRNLTYKHLMGLKWASSQCQKASFILKVDDDTVFNINKTYEFLNKILIPDRNDLIMGYILNDTKPRRNEQNKWYVTWEEYPRSVYPPYLSGWYYIVTPNIATMITDEAIYHPFFWIDDIFVTGLLTESLGLKLRQLPQDYWLEYYEHMECCLRDMIKKSIKCDYVVGPNGRRNNLIVEFNEAFANCQKWGNCTSRAHADDLKKGCVMFRDRTIFSDGQAEIQHINL